MLFMKHDCKTLIIHCIDFRFGEAIKNYLKENQMLGDCDIVSVAGAAKNIADPKLESDKEFILRQIDISESLHHIKELILMNHEDCGGYGGRKAFASYDEEKARLTDDMKKAAEIIKEKYQDIRVRTVLAKIDEDGIVSFEKAE